VTAVLELRDIVKVFGSRGTTLRALDGVSLTIERGTTYGLVGESGSGKSTLARCALQLITPTSGISLFEGHDLQALGRRGLSEARANMGVVFQNPAAALNPRMRVAAVVAEPLITHTKLRKQFLRDRVLELLDEVGLAPEYAHRLPHQLSGGQCQRVGIARALAMRPRLIVLDEPTSALDVSVQAQILNLLRELRVRHDLTFLLISHDLDVVRYMSDSVGVMCRGRMVEEGPASFVLETPQHQYTQALLAATSGAQLLTGDPTPPSAHLATPTDPQSENQLTRSTS